MPDLQQTIQNLAQQIPGYGGYQIKERRRDADRVLRQRLATQYERERDRLTRVMQDAARSGRLGDVEALQHADQQLQRLVTRLRTGPTGYSGWFDAAQILEADLDQLYQFDASLASGVEQLAKAIDAVSAARQSGTGLDDATAALVRLLDELNGRLDARQEFLALGKRPSPVASPLGALQSKPQAGAAGSVYEQLKLGDAVSYDGTDYIVAGRITYSVAAGRFFAYLLQDRDSRHWLRVGPNQELAVTEQADFTPPSPLPDQVTVAGKSYARTEQGAASVTVEGASGMQTGAANYARFSADGGARLWVEDWGTETRVQTGRVIDPMEVRLYRKL